MTLKLRLFVVIGVLALTQAGLGAQRGAGRGGQGAGGQGPAGRGGRQAGPGANQPAPKGTGRIAGRIVSADTGNPIRRAQVRLSAPEIRVNRTDTTDNDGKYEFADLPAGRYRLQVSKTGYVTLEYGQAQ